MDGGSYADLVRGEKEPEMEGCHLLRPGLQETSLSWGPLRTRTSYYRRIQASSELILIIISFRVTPLVILHSTTVCITHVHVLSLHNY